MFNNDRFFEESNGLYTGYNQSKRLLYDRWKKPGDVTDIPRWGCNAADGLPLPGRCFFPASEEPDDQLYLSAKLDEKDELFS